MAVDARASRTPAQPPSAGDTAASAPLRRELGLAGLSEIALGYERAQVLFTASELKIFDVLASGPKPAAVIAAAIGAAERPVSSLLDACVALGLLRVSAGHYQNSRSASLFLRRSGDGSFSPVLRFWREFSYGPWGRLLEAVRENRPQTSSGPKSGDLFDALVKDEDQVDLFFEGLAGLAYWPAQRIAEIVDFGSRRHLLDIGGGSGAFSTAIATRHQHLQVTLFDLEPVCALARRRFAQVSADDRLSAVAGDFHNDALPRGADCALLSNVLHDWSERECEALVGRVKEALEPGGELVIYDFMPPADAPTLEAALFSLALLLDTNRGRVYSREQFEGWLRACGFIDIAYRDIGAGTGILTARTNY